ncbi:MAG: hypothetical protein BRC22_00980 [Parcubacteria group bacterium QH_9_35_7]|nr:MAG: hypothetical protein BRC22_00980 [Parcubacteria group bacterium QH_9_35_7]
MDNFILLAELLKDYNLWGNSAYQYLIAGVVFLISLLVLKLFEKIIAARFSKVVEKTDNQFDDVISEVINSIGGFFYFATSAFIAFQWLETSLYVSRAVNIIFIVIAAREVINGFGRLINFAFEKYLERLEKRNESIDVQQVRTIKKMLRKTIIVILWLIVGTFILANFGINITSLVTGLGIGGIAVGFALQNILGDIFSSVSIFFDKPFKVGDVIQVGEDVGRVKNIGIKSTRLKLVRGEELVIPNKELTSFRIQNYSKANKMRDEVTIGVSYETDEETLKQIPEMIEGIIGNIEGISLDRCNFENYGDSSINFKIIYFADSFDFSLLDKKKEELNYAIFSKFQEKDIDLPFPTRTVFLHQSE